MLQGLDALPLLLLLRLHLRHEARVDHEAWRSGAESVRGTDDDTAWRGGASAALGSGDAGDAPAGCPLEVTAMTLRARRGGRVA
jgi:hypothetical protein